MLPDWYFCCCIQAEPDPTAIFLSILDGLEDVEHDPELARLALGELGRMDVWMQGYALPSVLRLLGRQDRPAAGLRDAVRDYLAGLAEALPEDFAEAFSDLSQAVIGASGASGPGGIQSALRQCARSLRNLPLRQPSTLPYLDLKEFLPETVLLAVIAEQLGRDGAFATLFGESDDPEVAVLGPMLLAALRHELGRFAFRLALRIAPQVGSGYTAERLSAFLWHSPLTSPEREPDLLASWAELVFFDRPGGRGRPGLAAELIEESITLHHLRRQVAEARSRPQVSQPALHAVLPALTDEMARVLTTVLWQAVLWHLSARVDPAAAAERLAFLWHPPTGVPGGEVAIQGPSSPEARKQWWQELLELLRLRNLPGLKLYLPAAPRLTPGEAAWVLFSPWLHLNPDKQALKRFDVRLPRYPTWLNLAVEVRLMAAAVLAGRLLLTLPAESSERRSFAALLVHAYDVLNLFQLPPGGPGADRLLDPHPRLSPPMLALAIYTQRRIQRLGSCRDERLAPDIFLAPLRRSEAAEAAGELPALSYDERTFLDSILPSVLLSWVADAYPSATRGSGSARWLALIPELYERQGAQDFWHQLQGELIARFLAPGTARRGARFDWRHARTKAGPLGWSIGHRQLLLTLPLCADEWLRPEWNEPVDRPATVLARALERLAALKEPGGLPDEIAAQWRREWADLLSGVNSSRALDRFLRLRLLELLADPVLEHDPAGRELIVLTLLEFGSLYELEHLCDRVYPASEAEWAAPPPQTVQDLRLALLHALSQEAERSSAGSASRLNPQEPLFTRSALERERLIRETLRRVAFFSRQGGAAPHRRRLAGLLAREHERSFARQTDVVRRIEAEVELRGWRKQLLLPAGEDPPGEWRIRSAAYDPNFLTGQLLVEDWADDDCVDLFTLPAHEVHAFLDRRSAACVLASVVNVYRAREQFVATLHCGLRQYLKTTWPQWRFEPGQWVRLPVTWRGDRLEVDAQKEILRLRPRRRPERLELLRLREYRRDGVYTLELTSRGETQLPSVGPRQGAAWDLELWQADFARLFRAPAPGEPRPAEREAYARLDGAGQWRPLDRSLTHLLLAPAGFAAEGVAVLAYLDAAAGSSAWRFSLQLGEVYLLAASDFATADAEELEAELAQHPDARGLLVALRAEPRGERIELRLARDPVRDPGLLALYPELRAPFDRRNLDWRDLFRASGTRASGTEIAQRVDGRWSVTVDEAPPGFPAELRVQWLGQRPDQDEAEMTVVAWDPWKGALSGESVQTYRLTLRAGETPAEFVPRWLALKRGDRLPLVRALGRVSDEGEVLCRTAEGPLLSVEAESLSMRLLPQQGPPELRGARPAEIVSSRCWGRAQPAILDAGQLPPQLLDLGRAEGVLAQVPRRNETAGTHCEIWWHAGGEVLKHRVLIENLAQLQAAKTLAVGARIQAERRNGSWSFEVQPHRIRARALWTLAEWHRPARDLAYLGTVTVAGGVGAVAEQEPGRLLVLPAVPGGVRHLAEGDGRAFQGGLGPERRTYNASRGKPWAIGQSEYRRATLPFRDGVLCGTCRADAPQQNVALSQVWMVLEPRGDGAFFLRRSFRLTADAWAAQPPRSLDDAAIWRQKLQAYLEAPRDLDATLERGEVRLAELRVPGALPGDRWTSVVPLAAAEGPLVAVARYGKDAKVRLFEDAAGSILASCRLVPALTIDGYRSEVGNPDFGLPQTLAARLYYAGMERPAGAGGETYHRFEWGYGRMLLAPESRLRFNGEPFDTARELLYLEDAITNLTFLRPEGDGAGAAPRVDDEPPDEEATEPAPPLDEGSLLSLDGLSLALAEATSLFRQRSKYRVVHLLHLQEQPDGTLGIRSIVGMAEASMEATRSFRVDRATLDPASERALRRRWPAPSGEEEESEEPAARVVLARLDAEAFRASLGLDVVFRHVRMSFLSGAEGDGAPLEQSELVFVRAGRIGPRRNDMGLQLLPWKDLAAADVGADCAELLLLRRPFSVREDLLPRIYEGQGAAALEGSVLLVHLSERGGKIAAALWWSRERARGRRASRSTGSIPSRSVTALQKAAVEGVVLATVMEAAAAGLQVEIRPGVFVTVPGERIESRPQDLRPGAIVRIENAGERRFRISRATQGEEWYLTAGLRPAVALPMNTLLDAEKIKAWDPRSSIAWRGPAYPNECFSLGGLPNIVAVPGRFDERQGVWDDPMARDFIDLMQTPHPKVALVGRDGSGISRLQPAFDSVPWGSLAIDRERHEVRFRPFSQSSPAAASRPLAWAALSFADEPVSRIAARVEREKWRYHDTDTGAWSPSGGVRPQKLGDHSGLGGPLFFEAVGEELRLRYGEASLPRFGFPPRELVRALERRREGRALYTVAGVLPEGGLWLELAPGRIVNLPAPLVVTLVEGHEQSLSHLQWSAFAPGDQVTLQLASSDPMSVDRIALVEWRPGPRRALGRRCCLPVAGVDAKRGVTHVGAGEMQLDLPVVWGDDPPPAAVVLYSDNRVFDAGSRLPERGDIVLLGLDPEGLPIVLGFPELKPVVEGRQLESWDRDPLAEDLCAFDLPPRARAEQLASVIAAAGKALPVTVELALAKDKLLFFSRRAQRAGSYLAEGRVGQGRVVGLLRDGETALVRSGSGLLKASVRELVSGLPRELCAEAVKALLEAGTVLWMRSAGEGKPLQFGLGEEPGRTLQVEPIGVLSNETRKGSPRGVVCRARASRALYWLPAKEAAWATLSAAELALVFPAGETFKVRLQSVAETEPLSPSLSLIDLAEARKELLGLGVGKELTVRVLARRPSETDRPARYLVRTLSSRVVLECETYDDEALEPGQDVPVEVVRRRRGLGAQPFVITVPVGRRRYALDLPSWMLDEQRERGTLRPGFREYLTWCEEEPILPDLATLRIESLGDADLRRHLCLAWKLSPETGESPLGIVRFQIGVSREWIRRHQAQPEIELPYALNSLLLLQKNADRGADKLMEIRPDLPRDDAWHFIREWRQQAFELMQNLGQRALRSAHVEVIWQDWLRPVEGELPAGDLRRRLRLLEEALRPSVGLEVLRAFQQFCHAVELRETLPGNEKYLPLADALRRATGELERTDSLMRSAEITRGLVELYRILPKSRAQESPGLLSHHVKRLKEMLEQINAQAIDITLLDPLTGDHLRSIEAPSPGG